MLNSSFILATLVLIFLPVILGSQDRQAIELLSTIHANIVSFPNPNGDGTFIEVDMSLPPPGAGYWSPDPFYYLFTKENQGRKNPIELSLTDKNLPKILEKAPNYNRNAPLKILCHGFQSSSNNIPFPADMMTTSSIDDPPNVILIDWSSIAGSLNYPYAADHTSFVGSTTANLIASLLAEGLTDLDKIHIIGHSLGAHVAGIAGYTLAQNSSLGKISRITGMDPAGPFFCVGQDQRLDANHAKFVDVIHTDDADYCGSLFGAAYNLIFKARFGFDKQLGHVDFYPNGGDQQPGCPTISACSHGRSYDLMRESITSAIGFPARKCSSWTKYNSGKCKDSDGDIFMGENTPTWARGKYFLKTGKKGPYAKLI